MLTTMQKWVYNNLGVLTCVRLVLRPDVYSDGTVDRWVIETRSQHGTWKHYRNTCNKSHAEQWYVSFGKRRIQVQGEYREPSCDACLGQ